MADHRVNPLQSETEELSAWYVELVHEVMSEFAPYGPWWQVDVSPAQQLWRWAGTDAEPGPRLDIIGGTKFTTDPQTGQTTAEPVEGWLPKAYMRLALGKGYPPENMLKHIEDIFTDPAAPDLIAPPEDPGLVLDPELNKGFVTLLTMAQAAGAHETQVHIAKMERMFENQLGLNQELAATKQPKLVLPPQAPQILPVQLNNGGGMYPNEGGVPLGPGGIPGVGTMAVPSLGG